MPFAPLRHTSRYAFPICIAIVPLSANWGRHAPTRLSVFRMTRHMRNVTRGGTPHGGNRAKSTSQQNIGTRRRQRHTSTRIDRREQTQTTDDRHPQATAHWPTARLAGNSTCRQFIGRCRQESTIVRSSICAHLHRHCRYFVYLEEHLQVFCIQLQPFEAYNSTQNTCNRHICAFFTCNRVSV